MFRRTQGLNHHKGLPVAIEVRLSREMRLLDITMIGVGAMIGAGIFVLTGIAAGVAGPALLLVFGLNGFVALLTAMAYAELGSSYHSAGGGYTWVKTALPDPSGFLSGWMSWFAQAVACSLYALGFGAYFKLVLDAVGAPDISVGFMSIEKWLAILTVMLFSYINYRGASEAGKAGNVVTVGKVLIILAFIIAGLLVMAKQGGVEIAFTPFLSEGWGGVVAAMGLTFIAFEGYEIIAQTSEEVKNPRRNIPRAVFLSLLIVVPIYLLVAFVAVGGVQAPAGMAVTDYLGQEGEIALVRAADQFLVGGGILILVGGLLSTLSALNATIFSSSRVAFAMARDANLPPILGHIHGRRATPYVAILFSAALIMFMAVALPIEEVAAAADVMFLLLFVLVNLALIKLRKTRPDLDRGFKVPFVPFVPLLAVGTMLFLTIFLFIRYPMALLAVGGWIVAGGIVYTQYSRKREKAFVERTVWMERIERHEYSVLVALSTPRTLESLMEVGIAIAKRHGGEIVILSVAEVPEGLSLLSGRRAARKLEAMLQRAVQFAESRGIVARPVVTVSHRVSQGIVDTARVEKCNFLVMGQPDTQSIFERIVATAVDRVLQDAPCQVGVVYGTVRPEGISEILLPVTTGPTSRLAAKLAPVFGEQFGAPIRAVTIVERHLSAAEADKQVSDAQATLAAAGFEERLEVLRRRDVARGLKQATKRGTLVMMGAPTAESLQAILGETVPAQIAQSKKAPIVVVRNVAEHRVRKFEQLFFGRSR
ncbi:MAG TPA: amino acid permease [Gemmatimonadales bacterium]|nr:amino acid permease [Gemmatimonadales bacterium]